MKMLARAPTKWFRTVFVAGLFLSVFVLTKPLTAEAGCHNASCGCRDWGIDSCKGNVTCWYSTFDSSGHCSGHNFVDAWGAAGNCTQDADIQAYCNLCETWYPLPGYTARGHNWSAWTPYNANSHISYCQNTSAQTISGLPGGRTVTIYNACNATTTAPHNWSAVYDLKDGNQHAWKCTTCGYVYKENHKWTDWQDNGDGRHVRHCTVCGRTEYGEHTYGNIKMEGSQSSTHDKTVTYSFGCTTCPRVEHVKLTLHVSGVKEKGTESSRYKKSGQCPVSESAEYYTGTGTAEFWSGNNKSTDNKIVSQSVSVDENTGDRTSKNASDKASGNTNTFTWNKDEGIKYFRYTVTDARGHTYSIATDYSYLLDHTPPQISVSVNLPGWVSGSRKNSMAWIENAATVKGRSSDSGESAWSNKENPTITINCTTRNLDDSSEAYDHMKEIRLYKKVKEPSGIETSALLQTWKNTRSAVYTIPKGREDVEKNIDGSENLYGEGTGTYYVVAIDDMNRRAISNDTCPELIDTKSVYNELAKNNNYDYGLQADFGYDVNHVTVTPLTVHLDYMPPKIKDLTGNNSDNKSANDKV
jgi:rubredoxin